MLTVMNEWVYRYYDSFRSFPKRPDSFVRWNLGSSSSSLRSSIRRSPLSSGMYRPNFWFLRDLSFLEGDSNWSVLTPPFSLPNPVGSKISPDDSVDPREGTFLTSVNQIVSPSSRFLVLFVHVFDQWWLMRCCPAQRHCALHFSLDSFQ